jgi:hypothetical protein
MPLKPPEAIALKPVSPCLRGTADGYARGNGVRKRCDEAGLRECSSHELRRAMACRLA